MSMMPEVRRLSRKKGFTLAESLTTICISIVVIAAMSSSILTVRLRPNTSRHHYQAIAVAREKLEEIIHTKVSAGDTPPADEVVTLDAAYGITGTRSVSFSPDPATDTVTVTVTVSWVEPPGRNTSESLALFLNTI